MPSFLAVSTAVLATSQSVLAGFPTWPSPEIDELEDIRFLQTGYLRRGFIDFVTPCSFSAVGSGRINAAEWIRTAYHDMSTADVAAGTGGLDASIQFETDRGENIGAAMNTTLIAMLGYHTVRSSMADLLALGVFVAVGSCGGPIIPYRVGRTDAAVAGPTGVPEPSDDIETLTAKFARQGFNTSEMIGLVACGHTLGGVHGEDFPTVVPGSGTDGHNFSHFDKTTSFDNLVATEYVAGNTTNPLVVGPDAGKNSDLAVFNADGNKTIGLLADPSTYQSSCLSLLERMINTVPSTVRLSEPLEPYPIKPTNLALDLSKDGTNLTFSGVIRVRATERPGSDISLVSLKYLSRDGATAGVINTTQAIFESGIGGGFGETFQFYEFDAVLNSNASISSFNVSIALNNGTVEEHNNNGAGFPVQSSIMLQSSKTCRIANSSGSYFQLVAAVHESRKDLPATVLTYVQTARQGSVVPAFQVVNTPLTLANSTGPYDLYAATVSLAKDQVYNAYVDLVSGGDRDAEADLFNNMGNINDC